MDGIDFRVLDSFPEPAFSALAREAFADYQPCGQLTAVLDQEEPSRQALAPSDAGSLRLGAFREHALVGWTYTRPEGAQLHMVNSGVAGSARRRGVYSCLVGMALEHARTHGFVSVLSRNAAANNPVIIAKLKLGFHIAGFEYSEVYGPLVRMAFLVGEQRRSLYLERSRSIRRTDPEGG